MSEILKAFLENEAALRRYLGRCRASTQAIEDFAQETFLRGFAAELRGEIEKPKAYLFQIAKTLVLESLRKRSRRPVQLLEEPDSPDLILDENQAAADEWLEGRRKLALFVRAVAELPEQCRKAFLMRRIEGLQYKQIANRMGISVSAVEKHVTLGLLKCSSYLREHGYEASKPVSVSERGDREALAVDEAGLSRDTSDGE
jgi:RNA polymerase sigma factor (sigma-70 family)